MNTEAAKLKAIEDARKQKKEMAEAAIERAKHENEVLRFLNKYHAIFKS